jgi:5,6,7,8-tetrahydromethanopterin hydro-lyase
MIGTEFGEAFVGEGVNAAHINTVLGSVGGPIETAWATALATPRAGHAGFVASAAPGVALRPFTLFVNKAAIETDQHGTLTWGAAHAGVAGGVLDALADTTLDPALAERQLLIAAVWVNPEAVDAGLVYKNNRRATYAALAAGRAGRPTAEDTLTHRPAPSNAFFTPADPWPA